MVRYVMVLCRKIYNYSHTVSYKEKERGRGGRTGIADDFPCAAKEGEKTFLGVISVRLIRKTN